MKMKIPEWNDISVRVDTPEGPMFIHIATELGKDLPSLILINVAKNGSTVSAWAEAVARLASRLLPYVGVNGVIEEISGITTDKVKLGLDGSLVRSGPEGIAVALMKHRALWFKKNNPLKREGGPSLG